VSESREGPIEGHALGRVKGNAKREVWFGTVGIEWTRLTWD